MNRGPYPVRYYLAPHAELPVYSGLKSPKVLLWKASTWIEQTYASSYRPKTNRRDPLSLSRLNTVFETHLSPPCDLRLILEHAASKLPKDLRGVLLVWLSAASYEDSLHWGLAFDARARSLSHTYFFNMPPKDLSGWSPPEDVLPTLAAAINHTPKTTWEHLEQGAL